MLFSPSRAFPYLYETTHLLSFLSSGCAALCLYLCPGVPQHRQIPCHRLPHEVPARRWAGSTKYYPWVRVFANIILLVMALFLPFSPLPLPSPLLESDCRKRHRKETWLPGKMLIAGLDGQELWGRMLCWAHSVTIFLDTDASSFFFFRVLLKHITIQTKEHSHFNLLIFQKEAFCLPYPKTMEIIGKMFQIDFFFQF